MQPEGFRQGERLQRLVDLGDVREHLERCGRSGRVPGNGGGAPVKVEGWTCQGTDTTTTVQTGEASSCRRGSTEIIAVLKLKGSGSG